MKLDPHIAQEVREQLGKTTLPRPDDEAFEQLLEQLDAEKPELATKLRSGLIHQDLGDIETEARKHNDREMRGRRLKRTLLMRYDELDEKWHLSKVKALAWGSLGGMGLMAGLFLGAPLLGNEQPEVEVAQKKPPVEAKAPVVQKQEQDDDPFDGLAEELEQGERTASTFEGAQPMPQPATAGSRSSQPEEPMLVDEPTVADEPMLTEEPLLPSTSEEEELGLGVYSAAAATGETPQGLRAYRAGGGGGAGGAETDPFAEPGSAQEGAVGLAVYQLATSEEEVKSGLMSYRATPGEDRGVRMYKSQVIETTQAPQGTREPVESVAPPGSALHVNRLMTSGVALAQGAPEAPSQRAPRQKKLPYKVGDSIPASLQVGVVAVDGTPLPVLARGEDGSIWQGQATLTPTGRVDIRFTEVLTRAGRHTASAVAQAGDGYLGLPAQVTETTPALASDLTRGALRGLSEYVQALGQESEVRVEGGTPVISRSAPPLEANIAGSVARLFTPPEGEDQQALVRLAQVPARTSVTVVVLSPVASLTTP